LNVIPTEYIGREQALLKHTILKTYIQRLFMIIGNSGETVINYVDCFAGPWEENHDDLRDTSIGISINELKKCAATLSKNHEKSVRFRALYIEKSKSAYSKLETFLNKNASQNIELSCVNGDFTDHINEIIDWSNGHFTFFFIDPKGWKGVVGPDLLKPLLELPKSEFLINLMYDFANRALSIEKHEDDIRELVGEKLQLSGKELPDERQTMLLTAYRNNIKSKLGERKGQPPRSSYVPVCRPGSDKLLYLLVYFTRHPLGIDVFKTESEKMDFLQRVVKQEICIQKKENKNQTLDLFGVDPEIEVTNENNNKYLAKHYIEEALKNGPTVFCIDFWADLLEKSDLYPTDFQLAMKELLSENKVVNLTNDTSKRRTKFIQPRWRNKSETWKFLAE